MPAPARLLAIAAVVWCLVGGPAGADAPTLEPVREALAAERYADAVAAADVFLQARPGHREARFLRARALAANDDPNPAIAAYRALVRDFPQRVEPLNNLAVLLARQGDIQGARQALEKALATQPAYAAAHRNLADVYSALADVAYGQALEDDTPPQPLQLAAVDRLYFAREPLGTAVAATGADGTTGPDNADGTASVARNPQAPDTEQTTSTPEAPPATADADSAGDESGDVSTDADATIVEAVRSWAEAWSNQRFDAYVDFYADAFSPDDGLSRSAWRAERRQRLNAPDNIEIEIENPRVTRLAADRVAVDFSQSYRSPRYSDRVDKRLVMVREDDAWRILRETTPSD